MIARIRSEIPANEKVLLLSGGGSIRENGVYEQVMGALEGFSVTEFSGIPANPTYEKCMEALALVKNNDISFLLAVGGGSVIDAAKFIALARYSAPGESPWEMMRNNAKAPSQALPIGAVLTLPATGSEWNSGFVISRLETNEKLTCGHFTVFPQFSVLDPETTFSLPKQQLRNGLVDCFVHVLEQYMTIPNHAPLQDRQAEAVLSTVIEIAEDVMTLQNDYNSRASMMWCASQALNGLLNRGVIMDWATHDIGHRLTATYHLDHAATLAIILPGVWENQIVAKEAKLVQYGKRVWSLNGSNEEIAYAAIHATEEFFRKLGMGTHFSDYGIDGEVAAAKIAATYNGADQPILGENRNINSTVIYSILKSRT